MRALFFSPHAGIWVHAFPEALVADALRSSGFDIVYVTCGGALSSFCITMASRGLSPSTPAAEREAVCRHCQRNRDQLQRGFRFPGYDFDSVLTADDLRRIDREVAQASPNSVAAFELDGLPVGRAALYEYLIQTKRTQFSVDETDWAAFRPRLTNAARSLVAAGKILDRERPERVITYNTLYSANAMWRAAAERRGIATYFLHAGSGLKRRLQTMMVGRDSPFRWSTTMIEAWRDFRSVPCSAEELSVVTEHFEQLLHGTSIFAYSTAKSKAEDVCARFGVRPDQKLLVASMSSYDEYVAAVAIGEMPAENSSLFPTQLDWIRALVRWIETRPELFLIIRVHPREFPNKRESTKSQHAMELERELVALPSNVRVNWPSDRLSIYDVAEHADVFLNAWSSVGKEMTLLGIPVVVYCPDFLLYPPDLNYVGTTHEAYFAAIEAALRDGWSFERTRSAYRWGVLELVRGVVDLGDGFDYSEEAPRTTLQRAVRMAFSLPTVRQRWDLARRPRRLRAQQDLARTFRSGDVTLLRRTGPTPSEAEETAALRTQVARLVRALYGDDGGSGGRLRQRLVAGR